MWPGWLPRTVFLRGGRRFEPVAAASRASAVLVRPPGRRSARLFALEGQPRGGQSNDGRLHSHTSSPASGPDLVFQGDLPMSTTTAEVKPKEETRTLIWDALESLRASAQVATRQRLANVTGLKLVTVDDHLKSMVEDGLLRRPVNGVVEIIDPM